MTNNDVRKAHTLLDGIMNSHILGSEDVEHLRSFLPERPKQKTLEEIHEEVYEKWLNVEGDLWDSDNWGTVEEFLGGLQYQLKDLIDAKPAKPAPATVPALPAGMRIANHADLGRVVVSPTTDEYDDHRIFHLNPGDETGAKIRWASVGSLTFIDAEPARPEFLETEADYANAPEGTIVAKDNISTAWIKRFGAWKSTDEDRGVECPTLSVGTRRVLRWGWGE